MRKYCSVRQCAAVRQGAAVVQQCVRSSACGCVRQCTRQSAAVRAVMCAQCKGHCTAVRFAVYGSARASVRQQCGSVRQCCSV